MATLSEQEREALLWRCPCGHNSWTAHSGRGCDECDCDRDEEGAVVATTEAILTARLAKVEALADEWDDEGLCDRADGLRAALASHPSHTQDGGRR